MLDAIGKILGDYYRWRTDRLPLQDGAAVQSESVHNLEVAGSSPVSSTFRGALAQLAGALDWFTRRALAAFGV